MGEPFAILAEYTSQLAQKAKTKGSDIQKRVTHMNIKYLNPMHVSLSVMRVFIVII